MSQKVAIFYTINIYYVTGMMLNYLINARKYQHKGKATVITVTFRWVQTLHMSYFVINHHSKCISQYKPWGF